MTDEPRAPLGDLNPADYYAEGLDASSVVLVADEVEEPEKPSPIEPAHAKTILNPFAFATKAAVETDEDLTKADIQTILAMAAPAETITPTAEEANKLDPGTDSADIDIWESESAKDENEKVEDAIFAA